MTFMSFFFTLLIIFDIIFYNKGSNNMDMNSDFYTANNYFLVDIFDGKLKKRKIIFRIVKNSSYNVKNAKQVEIETNIKKINAETGKEYYQLIKHTAFIKHTNNPYSDSL